MKVTRASIAEYIAEKGYEPIQIDGIPEGFSFHKKQDRSIGGIRDLGALVAFIPLIQSDQRCQVFVPIQVDPDASEEIISEVKKDCRRKLLKLFKEYR